MQGYTLTISVQYHPRGPSWWNKAIKRKRAYRLTKVKSCFCGMIAYALNHTEYTDDYRKADKPISLGAESPYAAQVSLEFEIISASAF